MGGSWAVGGQLGMGGDNSFGACLRVCSRIGVCLGAAWLHARSQSTRPPFSCRRVDDGDPSPIMHAPLQRAAGGEAGRTARTRNLTPPPPFSMQHF